MERLSVVRRFRTVIVRVRTRVRGTRVCTRVLRARNAHPTFASRSIARTRHGDDTLTRISHLKLLPPSPLPRRVLIIHACDAREFSVWSNVQYAFDCLSEPTCMYVGERRVYPTRARQCVGRTRMHTCTRTRLTLCFMPHDVRFGFGPRATYRSPRVEYRRDRVAVELLEKNVYGPFRKSAARHSRDYDRAGCALKRASGRDLRLTPWNIS